MNLRVSLAVFLGCVFTLGVQTQSPGTRIQLFLIERPVGFETVTMTPTNGGRTITSDMALVDRGTRLQLSATLSVGSDGSARHFKASGRSYRFVNVDAEVIASGSTANVMSMGESKAVPLPPVWFPARSWAPVAARAALISYWEQKKRPASMALLPGDPDSGIVVTFRGEEAIAAAGRTVRLRRYSVDGVVWGRETVWVDEQGAFAALVSRIHILPFEAVREDLVSALPALQESSVRDRMADLAAFSKAAPPVASGTFALIGARVYRGGANQAPILDGLVLVRDGRIAAVGPRAEVKLPPGVRTIDLKGATVMPGLIDMHAHASQIEWAPAYLAAGVTTIRDMGGEARFLSAMRNEIASGRGLGPRVELAGLVDGPGESGFGTVIASTAAEGRAVVDRYHGLGFSQMKLYSLVQPDVVEAITARARELKMPVTGHVPSALGLEKAILAGMDQIAHLSVRQSGTPDSDRVIALLAARQIAIDPTQAWGELLGRPREVPAETVERGMAYAPYPLAANYRSVQNNPRPAPAAAPAAAPAPAPARPSILKMLYDKGVPIIAGTDGALPGFSLLRELELYVQAGLTPIEALQTGTSNAARALSLDAELGSIAEGKRADLVVIEDDPLVDISNIRRTRFVITNGKMYEPAALWKLAGFREPRP